MSYIVVNLLSYAELEPYLIFFFGGEGGGVINFHATTITGIIVPQVFSPGKK